MGPAKRKVVSRREWRRLRTKLLSKEKDLTRKRDRLAAQIRELPWVKVDKSYVFQTPRGRKTLMELFEGRSQLLVYHFMLGPGWSEGCPSCSFWADQFGGLRYHLPQRDVAFKVISRAPLKDIQRYQKRMGWKFDWVSSSGSGFNLDFGVSSGKSHESPGISVF